VHGFAFRVAGASSTTPKPGAPAPLPADRSLVVGADGRLETRPSRPNREVALTFDDGPDASWTPRIAAELRRLDVPATFFVVGREVLRHPDVVRALVRNGFDLGLHGFTHTDPGGQPDWRRSLELGLSETLLADIAGRRLRLYRLPNSSGPTAVTRAQRVVMSHAVRRGNVIALTDLDGRDWAQPGVSAIVRDVTPGGNRGGIILLHDGGGDRSQTLDALPRVVARLRARGFRFVSLADVLHVSPAELAPRATASERLRGRLLWGTLAVSRAVVVALSALVVLVSILVIARVLLVAFVARRHVRAVGSAAAEPFSPPASIIVPAFNEAVVIEQAVRSLAASDYPEFEVLVVDDGSTDGTADIVERLALPRVRTLRQPNAGKPGALNRGIAAAAHEVLVMVDADTVFERDTLRRIVAPLRDDAVGAASGNTKVGNRRRLLGRWQHVEYVLGFNLDRRFYDVLGCMPTVPGAIGAWRRSALADVGGVSGATLAEDTDLTMALGRAGWRVVYAENARAWTEAPASLGALWRQRYRWSYGTMQSIWKHRAAVWRPGEHAIGRRAIPYLVLFQVLLPLLAPLVDLFALYGLFFVEPIVVLAAWGAFNVVQLALGAYAFRLDREPLRALWVMPLQQLVYRQLMYLVVIESVISALTGARQRWQHLERSGDVQIAR